MEKKPGLRDLIEKNLKWILTITGFITGISVFIAAIRQDIYLYAMVIGVILMIGSVLTCIHLAFARNKPKKEGEKGPYRYPKWRTVGLGGLVVLAILVIVLSTTPGPRTIVQYAVLGTPTPTATATATPTRTPSPTPTEVVLPPADVLIAEFDSRSATRKVEVARRLEADLQDRLRQYGLQDISVKVLSQSVTNEDEAQMVANQTESKVVIWGWYDDLGISVQVFLSGGDQPGTELLGSGEISLVDSDPAFIILDVLPENISFLSLFVIGHLNYLANQIDEGRAAFDAAMASMPETIAVENEALIHFFNARQFDLTGSEDFETIVCEYAMAIDANFEFVEAYNNLGVYLVRNIPYYVDEYRFDCLYNLGIDKRNLFDMAIDQQPDWVVPAYNKWVTYWTVPAWRPPNLYYDLDMQLVIDGLEQVVQREPTFNAARVALSQIWLEEGNLEEAIEWMERAINQGSSQPKDYFNLGQLYLRVGDLPAAKDEFAKALEGNLDEMEAHLALASLALQAGDKAVAQNHLDQIPQLTYVPRSDTYFDKTASQFYPMTVEAMAEILRSQLAFEDGNLPKAIEHLEKNVTAHEDADRHSPFEYYLLGLLYSLMDDAEKAQENWTRNEDNFILFDLSADPELSLKISNVISALAWFDLVEDCGESDIMEWGSENNPCLPNKIEDRIAAIYERFHQWLPYRMYYIKHRSEALMYLP